MRKDTRRRRANVIVVAIAALIFQSSFPFPTRAASELDDACNGAQCGMGHCRVSPGRAFRFVCDCEPGWTQFRVNQSDDPFRFLPCIIPNCTFNYACYNESMPEPPSIPPPHNFSIFDSCFWSYCGGGNCVKTSGFKHRCECKKGFGNILNITSFPCVKDCAVGADCSSLGFALSNGSFPPNPTNLFNNGGHASSQSNLLWLLLCTTLLAMIQVTWMKL